MNEHLHTAMCIHHLEEFLEDVYDSGPNDNLPARQSFVYRHARNIAVLSDDVHSLEADDRISSCLVLMRPLFESLMNLAAAVNVPSFAAEKMIADIEHDIYKLQRWQEFVKHDEPDVFRDTIDLLSDCARSVCEENGITRRRKWTVEDVAKQAKLDAHYMREYFMYSRNSHASVGGVIAQEYECGREMILHSVSYITLSAVGYAVQALPCSNGQHFIDQTTRLLELLNDDMEHRRAKGMEPTGDTRAGDLE